MKYCANLKVKSRQLRSNLTESERALWSGLRSKQVLGVQFYRQKPIGEYIVDFFAPRAKWVIEVDGSQHVEEKQAKKDKNRDDYLASLGFKVLRFTSREVLKEREAVAEVIYRTIKREPISRNPPWPPFAKGGIEEKNPTLALMPLAGEGRVRESPVPGESPGVWLPSFSKQPDKWRLRPAGLSF